MSNELPLVDRRDVRATDSNSLLRMYDRTTEIFNRSQLQGERARADKVIQRIAKELRLRNIRL